MEKLRKKPVLLYTVIVLVLIFALIVSYVGYVMIGYHRIGDASLGYSKELVHIAQADTEYSLISYNIGFGAYTPDFSFFMDDGEKGKAESEESVEQVMNEIAALLKSENPDFLLMEEVDEDATRSYHFNQKAFLEHKFYHHSSIFAVNFDSPYLFFPFHDPHGKSLSGILSLSRFKLNSGERVSLPVEGGLMKYVDLDRCYSKTRVAVENSGELVLYNVHLSAYTSDGKVSDEQLKMLISDMQSEYKNGNYVICGGDFNKDLLMDSGKVFGYDKRDLSWVQPFPKEYLQGSDLSLVVPFDEKNPVPSCRNANKPYGADSEVFTVDGFIVSPNVKVGLSSVMDTGFAYSDHNPVKLTFKLMKNEEA